MPLSNAQRIIGNVAVKCFALNSVWRGSCCSLFTHCVPLHVLPLICWWLFAHCAPPHVLSLFCWWLFAHWVPVLQCVFPHSCLSLFSSSTPVGVDATLPLEF